MGGGVEEQVKKLKGLKNTNWYLQNSQGYKIHPRKYSQENSNNCV